MVAALDVPIVGKMRIIECHMSLQELGMEQLGS
jgi:hypothetical protein